MKSPWFEVTIWVAAIFYLFFYDPFKESDFTFCIYSNLGFEYCPGCGLGRSVSYLLHGEPGLSWETHKLGLLALPMLLYRIVQISYTQYNFKKKDKALWQKQ
ncbi:MAG: DUF2752 domain-containing protein [Ignavibacteria bacterium]|nr:DUF2752 domain-containing protein [Ignavibacteria bacterium]